MLSVVGGARSDLPAESKHPYPTSIPATGTTASQCESPHCLSPQIVRRCLGHRYGPRPQILLRECHGQSLWHPLRRRRANFHRRAFQHKFHHFEGFTERYDVTRLPYWESYDDVHKALAREVTVRLDAGEKDCLGRTAKSSLAQSGVRVVSMDAVGRR